MDFQSRLQKAIDAKGITLYDIGKNTSVSKQSVMGYLKEEKPAIPSIDAAITLAQYLEVNPSWLIVGVGEMYSELKVFIPDDLPKQIGKLYRAPIYESYPVSAGKYGLAEIREEKPDGYAYTTLPGVVFFPVVGCSFEPEINAGQYIGVVKIDSWDRFDTEKIYFILTRQERMIKRLKLHENKDKLWCISPNYSEFDILKDDILEINHVFFHGKMI